MDPKFLTIYIFCICFLINGHYFRSPGVSAEQLPPEPAIINGDDSKPGEFRWMVSVQQNGSHLCGGVIISDTAILTAAHCLYTCHLPGCNKLRDKRDIVVMLGINNLNDASAVSISVRNFTVHGYYRNTDTNLHWDIAVLELAKSIKTLPRRIQYNIATIKLPAKNYTAKELKGLGNLRVAGWGYMANNVNNKRVFVSADILQKALLPILTYEECSHRFKNTSFFVTKNVYCTDSTNVDICLGDSGGPLAIERPTGYGLQVSHELVGIVSLASADCARSASASIYTRVFPFMGFIQSELDRFRRRKENGNMSV